MNMDSGSEDEFFDATEDLSPKKSVGKAVKSQMLSEIQAEAESGLKENQKVVKEQPKLLKQSSSESLETERENMLMKDSEIVNLQTQEQTKLVEISQHIEQVKISTDDDNSTKKISQTIDTSNLPTDTKVELNIETITKTIETTATQNTNIETKATQNTNIESSPPAPVAPPRRKRKQKKDVKQDEKNEVKKNTAAEDIDNEVSKVMNTEKNENAPFIKVSLSTNEMSQVLESGNSLEVVFNNDLMTRRSGGPLTSPSSPEIRNAKTGLLRVNSISGRPLTDAEILEQVGIKNLDTGETIPLSLAEEKLPECTNPLALHILRLATEQNSGTNLPEYDEGHLSDASVASGGKIPGKKKKLKKFFGKTVEKIRAVADGRRMDESSSSDDEQLQDDGGYIKFKNHRAIKERLMFNKIKLLQDLSGEHIGAVWTMKFSLCGKLLATAGQDNIVRVWVLKESASNFEEMRLKYSRPTGRKSPTESMTSSTSVTSTDEDPLVEDLLRAHGEGDDENDVGPFRRAPFVSYHGHTSDVLDLSWSKNYFLLSSSMDKTVRLWHISRQECLCCFQHVDFVTAICFHPKDDRYFLSGSLDGKIRLWNIPEKKVALWNEIDGSGTSLITAANFCQNGKLAVVGTYDGRCIFYDTERLKYHTQVTVRSSRGKNARGRKISGIEPMPGEDKVLITSNDSRIRLYDLKDHSLYCKYKGLNNESSQIRAGFSHDGKMILCGSEDKFVYIWQTHHDVANVRNDRNEYYECFSAHDAVVTAAIFAPYPATIMEKVSEEASETDAIFSNRSTVSKDHLQKPFEVLVAADWHGGVKLFINK